MKKVTVKFTKKAKFWPNGTHWVERDKGETYDVKPSLANSLAAMGVIETEKKKKDNAPENKAKG